MDFLEELAGLEYAGTMLVMVCVAIVAVGLALFINRKKKEPADLVPRGGEVVFEAPPPKPQGTPEQEAKARKETKLAITLAITIPSGSS